MMVRLAFAVLAMLSVACTKPADSSNLRKRDTGSNLPPDNSGDPLDPGPSETGPRPAYRSGKRLLAKVYQTDDGAKAWHGWHDSQLGVECTFAMAEDSTQRCLPHANNYVYFYLDAACKAPVYVHRGSCKVPDYVSLNQGCANVIFQPEKQIGVGSVYRAEGGNCVETEVPEGTLYTVVHKPGDVFVAAAEVLEPRGALEARFLEAEDGALQLLGAYDPETGTPCAPRAPDYGERCAPEPATALPRSSLRYVGENCEKQAIGVGIQCGIPTNAAAALVMPDTFCGTPSLLSLGPAHEGPVSLKVNETCSAAPNDGPMRYYELGEKVDAASLKAISFVEEGSGRIRTRYLASETGEVVSQLGFVDSSTGQECEPIQTPAGLRCVPKVGAHALFSDSSCQKPVAEVYRGSDCQSAPAPTGVLSRTDNECAETTFRYFKVGAETTPTDLYLNAASCQKELIDTTETAFFETSEVPAQDFAAVQDVTE